MKKTILIAFAFIVTQFSFAQAEWCATDQMLQQYFLENPEAEKTFWDDQMKLSELSTEPGYWRSNADSEIYSPCSKGYRGLNANALAEERCCPKKQTT